MQYVGCTYEVCKTYKLNSRINVNLEGEFNISTSFFWIQVIPFSREIYTIY